MQERALIVVESLAAGGLVAQARLLVQRLASRGVEPHVAVLGHASEAEFAGAASVAFLGRRHRVDPFAAWKLRTLVGKLRVALVHTFGQAAKRHAGLVPGRKLLATLGRVARPGASLPGVREPDLVVVTSDAIAAETPGAPFVVPPGVATGEVAADDRDAFLTELGLPNDARVIVAAGSMLPRKGVKELLWAGDLVRVMHDNVRLLVAGDGPELPALIRYARMVSGPDHLRVLGPRSDVDRLLAHAEIFWHAGDELAPPMALLQAMAAGVPVVADSTMGAQQAVTDGTNGRLVPAGGRAERARATDQLLLDADLSRRLGEAARATVANQFAADRMADDYVGVYESLLG